MSLRPTNLSWVRSFEAAARHASFTKAAEELGLTQAAISQHIQALEQECKTRLFARGRRGVALTPQGADYLAMVQGPLLSITSSTESMFSGRMHDTITIALQPGIAMYWLLPRLHRLVQQVPDVGIALYGKDFDYPEARLEPDFVIEFGSGDFLDSNAHCLFMDRVTPVCSPSMATEDWESLPLISVQDGSAPWEDWFRMVGSRTKPNRQLTFDLFPYAYEAARLGLGIPPRANGAFEPGDPAWRIETAVVERAADKQRLFPDPASRQVPQREAEEGCRLADKRGGSKPGGLKHVAAGNLDAWRPNRPCKDAGTTGLAVLTPVQYARPGLEIARQRK
jgi:DNA-binding transcriptional LysR family regulator